MYRNILYWAERLPVWPASVAVAVVQVRIGNGRGLAGRVVRAAGYDAKVTGAQHGVLAVGRRSRQVRRQLRQIVSLLVQPGRTAVAELSEQRPERGQELLAVRRRIPSVLMSNAKYNTIIIAFVNL